MHQNMVNNTAELLLDSALVLINHYDKQISGARTEVDGLKTEINSMIKRLRYHNKDEKDEKFKEWVGEIGTVIRDVEDTITSCAKAARKRSRPFVIKCLDSNNGNGSPLVKGIRELRDRTKSAFEIAVGKLDQLPCRVNSQRSTVTSTVKKSAMQENLAIFKKEMDAIMDGLNSGKRQIFAIAGKSGSGKTTLARDIYKKAGLGDTFHISIWVDVSEEFNKEKVLRTILSFDGVQRDDWQEFVRENLSHGDFLIFFDNVCTKDAWDGIQLLLPLSNKQGRVVITTHDEDLTLNLAGAETHTLPNFDESKRWEYLRSAVFDSRAPPQELLAIGKEIAQCLDGTLLDIVVMGGVLRQVPEVEMEWGSILKNLRAQPRDPLRSISLSYEKLSYELRVCFLYSGIFSRGNKIPVEKLGQLWIAEGFIHHQEERSLEDIAKDYVHELVDKKLMIVENEKLDGGFKTCHVHDLVRPFCMSRAKDCFKEIKVSIERKFEPEFDEIKAFSRIYLHSSSSFKNFLEILNKEFREEFLKAHSVLAFCNEKCSLKEKELPSISEGLNLLRVLDINMAINFQKFPAELTKLVLLKYVTLSGHDKFDVLPKEIYKLWNVQTLEVHTSSPTLEVKASSIWKMKQLRHFKTKASIILIKRRASRNGARDRNNVLSTLEMLSPQSCTEEVFKEANNLKSLGIYGELDKLSCSLENLNHIDNLNLVNDRSRAYAVADIRWFPRNLKSLVLSGTKLESEHMLTLGNIGTLEVLKLENNEFGNNDCWDAGGASFTSLKSLHISSEGLKRWNASDTAFCKLEIIVLRQCKSLAHIPEDLVMNLEHLQLLHMDGVSTAAAEIGDSIIKHKKTFFEVIVHPLGFNTKSDPDYQRGGKW